MSQQAMIQVRDLAKDYGRYKAVRGITFDVYSGEVLGFLGPNGAGKSTTMKMLTCYMSPTSGTASVGGHNVSDESLGVRQQIGYLPEDTPLYTDMTALEFLQYVAALRRVPSDRRARRIRELSDVCGLSSVLQKPIGELSKGFRQRVGLAQAMIHNPPILILDEPTSGLDPNQIVEIRELIKSIGREKTVILSTHILPEVQATCGRVIIISEGKLVADGTPDELSQRDAGNVYRVQIEGEQQADRGEPFVAQVCEKLSAVAGVDQVQRGEADNGAITLTVTGGGQRDLRRDLFCAVRDSGWILLELQRQAASLEDVFRRLTTRE